MKHVRANSRLWIAGTAVAIAGVVLARWLGPAQATRGARVACALAGQLVALAGLGLICVGVSRRLRRDAVES